MKTPTRPRQRRTQFLAVLLPGLFVLSVHATEFDIYQPDKTGQADCSALLSQALKDAAKDDKVLNLSQGKYLLAKPVGLPPHLALVGTGGVTISGADRRTDLFHAWRNHGNTIKGISFAHCRKALTCEGDGYFASARLEGCSFSDCDFGLDFPCLQVVWFTNCNFTNCDYGIRGLHGYGGRSNGIILNGCSFLHVREWGLEIEGGPVIIRDCGINPSDGGGFHIMDAMAAIVEGCYFEGTGAKTNCDVLISSAQLYNGVVAVRNNQFMGTGADTRIIVRGRSGAHIYDNFAHVLSGGAFVRNESDLDAVSLEHNFIESSPVQHTLSDEAATKRAGLIVEATAAEDPEKHGVEAFYPVVKRSTNSWGFTDCRLTKVTPYIVQFDVIKQLGGETKVEPGQQIQICFNLDGSPTHRGLLPKKGDKRILYLQKLRDSKGYRAIQIKP